MQLKEIEYVRAVATEGSFSAAAQKCFISQPALSQAVKRLEKELGVVLFDRSTSYVRLTSAGEFFLSEGENILRLSAQLGEQMRSLSQAKKGKIRMGISTFYSSYYLVRILPSFYRLHPGVQIEIVEGTSQELEEMALKGEVDFSLIPFPLVHEQSLSFQILQQEQLLFAIPASSPLRSQLKTSLSHDFPYLELANAKQEPFLFLTQGQRFYKRGIELCREAGFEPQILCELTNWDAINSLISAGLGVGFVPELVTERRLAGWRSPIYCRLIGQETTRSYAVVYSKHHGLSPVATDFVEFLPHLFRR